MKRKIQAQCSNCSQKLLLNRINYQGVIEFQTKCTKCGRLAIIRELRCGGCHGRKLFEWMKNTWRCLKCGHTRSSSPPKTPEPTYPTNYSPKARARALATTAKTVISISFS